MSTIRKVGVIGAGTMGHGIAQACVIAGVSVTMVDIAESAVLHGLAAITTSLDRLVKKEKITLLAKDTALKLIHGTTRDNAVADCDLVIEAATENEAVKCQIAKRLDEIVKPDAILATNTSSISVTRLAAATARAPQYIGMHFFNPVPMMSLVELVRGLQTADETVAAVEEFARQRRAAGDHGSPQPRLRRPEVPSRAAPQGDGRGRPPRPQVGPRLLPLRLRTRAMSFETILLEEKEPGICLLTINRPKQLNALSPQVLYELAEGVAEVAARADVRALLLTGAGDRAFVAGADISAMGSMTPLEGREFALKGHATLRALELAPMPVIALVNGFALGGGCELALACDWIVASEKAVFGQPEVNLGICPGFGGSQRLSRVVGKSMAMELVCTGRQVKADEALRIGLANHVVPPEKLVEYGMDLARMIAQKGPVAVKMSKHLIQRGQDIDLANANAMEADVFGLLFATDDRREGMAAFLGKRPPAFAGR
jgi:enoyl-CoA hydratase